MASLIKCFSTLFQKLSCRSSPDIDPNDSAIGDLLSNYPANPISHPELNPMSAHLENVIAFVNPKSGGQKGRIVFEKFKNYMKKEQIFDLTKPGGPRPGLEMYKDRPNLKIIACGGDGTAGWVLSAIDEMNFTEKPAVAILPLGTGNDLARTLNWGGGYNNELIEDFLYKVINGSVVKLDRWTIKVTPRDLNHISIKKTAKTKLPLDVMNNYFSIGADAKVACDFHSAREKNPSAFSSQAVNKIEYAKNYSKDLFQQSCKNLKDNIEVFECDDKDVLDVIYQYNCHSILFLNIPSYAAGRNPWNSNKSNQHEQSFSDGKLEVIGFHTRDFMLLAVGGHGDKIAQASKVRIVTKKEIPMQVDGEPVLLAPAEITIERKNQSLMIQSKSVDEAAVVCNC